MYRIKEIKALEILDSRGRPTVKSWVVFETGVTGHASVPSGASTGKAEAHELRDGDPLRYSGLGCQKAVHNIEGEIRENLAGKTFSHQFEFEQYLISLDGTKNKSRLGANSILSVSLAFARASAKSMNLPLYRYFARLIENENCHMPRLTINLFSGGLHAGKQVAVQDCLVVPLVSVSIRNALSTTYAVYQTAAELIKKRYGMRLLTADEGGLSPSFSNSEEMLSTTVDAISMAGFQPGEDVALALDVAATHFYQDNVYVIGKQKIPGSKMIDILQKWTSDYPVISIEDGLAEDDWHYWPELMSRCGENVLIMGDDLLCTNPERIKHAISVKAANALLLKVNQIGTLVEAARALKLARDAGWHVTISARSGETEDNWLADLAVGWCANDIKIGSITQSERLAKYNRLLEIEREIWLSQD